MWFVWVEKIKREKEERVESLLSTLRDIETMGRLKVLEDIIEETIIDSDEKLLIFTEYRKTQEHIKEHLSDMFGEDNIELLNGDMGTRKKYKAIKRFNQKARILISTEAGGEGLDMHQECHIMVNYDIPWNPMRLHQRTGRLDRYGQKNKVLRFDIVAEGTIDDKINQYLDEKMETIEDELSHMDGRAIETLKERVLGKVQIDEKDMAAYHIEEDEDAKRRLDKEFKKDIERIRQGEEEILKSLRGITPEDYTMEKTSFGLKSLKDFMVEYLSNQEIDLQVNGDDIRFELPDEIKEIGFYDGEPLDKRVVVQGTFNRDIAQENNDSRLLGFGDPYLDAIIDKNINRTKSGEVGKIIIPPKDESIKGERGLLGSYIIRNEKNGKLRFDGVEFCFLEYGSSRGGFHYEDDLTEYIVKKIINGEYEPKESLPDEIKKDEVNNTLERMEKRIRRIDRGGKLGGTIVSSLGYIKFKEKQG